jgi:hypothetical protein
MKVPRDWYDNVQKMYKQRYGPDASSGVAYDPHAHTAASALRAASSDSNSAALSAALKPANAWGRATKKALSAAPWMRPQGGDPTGRGESARGAALREYAAEAAPPARSGASRAGSVREGNPTSPFLSPPKGKDGFEDGEDLGGNDEAAAAGARARWASVSKLNVGQAAGGIRAFSAVGAERRRREEAAWRQQQQQQEQQVRRVGHLAPRSFAAKTPVDDSQPSRTVHVTNLTPPGSEQP